MAGRALRSSHCAALLDTYLKAAVASLNALARLAFFTGSGYLTERGIGVTAIAITN